MTALLIGAAYLALALGAFAGFASLTDRQNLATCIQKVTTATENLKKQFPSGSDVPADNLDLLQIRECQKFLDDVLKGPVPPGNSAAIQNLRNLINQGLQNVGTCTITAVEPSAPKAGIDGAISVTVNVPFAGDNTGAFAKMTVLGQNFGTGMSTVGPGLSFGTISVPRDVSAQAAGEVSQVVVTAGSPIPPLTGGQCPAGSTPQGGQCIVSCTTAPKNVVWENPPIPEIKLFLVAPSTIDPANPTPIGLTWIVKNAKSVSIDQGVGEVDEKTGIVFELPPDKDTIYTLTAVGVRLQDTKTATQKVTVKLSKPLTVSINSPGGNSEVTGNSVAVTGTVFPVPTVPGSMTATISVNGVPKQSVPVDGAGNFSGNVALAKTTNPSLLNLVNPNLGVGGCGDRSTAVVVQNFNTPSDVENVIAVTVTDGSQQGSASVAVFHAVRLFDFVVNWLSCPPINKNEERNIVLGPLLQQFIGTVDCGCNNAPGGCHGPCTVEASVATSLGILFDNATWTFNVPGPCP